MGIFNKIFGKKEPENKPESAQSQDNARREQIKAPFPEKTSILDKVKTQKEQRRAEPTRKSPKIKAQKAAEKANQGKKVPIQALKPNTKR